MGLTQVCDMNLCAILGNPKGTKAVVDQQNMGLISLQFHT